MKPRISMITLGVTDMQRAITFYEKGLDLPRMEPHRPMWRFSPSTAHGWGSLIANRWLVMQRSRAKELDLQALHWHIM